MHYATSNTSPPYLQRWGDVLNYNHFSLTSELRLKKLRSYTSRRLTGVPAIERDRCAEREAEVHQSETPSWQRGRGFSSLPFG
ncbi:hypothetical protein SRHO_G00023860 [Serrasalmus rhombeus]